MISISESPTYHIFLFGFFEIFFNANKKGYLDGLSSLASLAPIIILKYLFQPNDLHSFLNRNILKKVKSDEKANHELNKNQKQVTK